MTCRKAAKEAEHLRCVCRPASPLAVHGEFHAAVQFMLRHRYILARYFVEMADAVICQCTSVDQ